MKRKIAFFLTALLLLSVLCGCGGREHDLDFTQNKDGASYSVTGLGVMEGAALVIPDTYRDLPVTDIGFEAFVEEATIVSAQLPASIKTIGDYAFLCCTALERVDIPEGVEVIGGYAFADCAALRGVKIPDSVVSIGVAAFEGTQATMIKQKVTYVDTWAVDCDADVSDAVLREGTRGLADYAFVDGVDLKNLTIPASVVRIGDFALRGCTDLVSITYGGTRAQWENLRKGEGWNDRTGAYTVVCSDGTLTKG